MCVTIVRDYFCGWETTVLTAKLIKRLMWHMAHSKGDWMGQTWIECDYGAWRVQFKYPACDCWSYSRTVLNPGSMSNRLARSSYSGACLCERLAQLCYPGASIMYRPASRSHDKGLIKDNFGAICNQCDHIGLVSNPKHVLNGCLLLTFFEQFLRPHFIHILGCFW